MKSNNTLTAEFLRDPVSIPNHKIQKKKCDLKTNITLTTELLRDPVSIPDHKIQKNCVFKTNITLATELLIDPVPTQPYKIKKYVLRKQILHPKKKKVKPQHCPTNSTLINTPSPT